jgi:hypothetical protein
MTLEVPPERLCDAGLPTQMSPQGQLVTGFALIRETDGHTPEQLLTSTCKRSTTWLDGQQCVPPIYIILIPTGPERVPLPRRLREC